MDAIKGISANTRRLLQIEEGQGHDFKETLAALKIDDLVAFANAGGGTILIGVSTRAGARKILGCPVGDKAELSVRQQAADADPPLDIKLRAENTAKLPILLVHIAASAHRPHCTQSGRYLLRDGNKNRALKPTEMLRMFLDTQAEVFVARFNQVTQSIRSELENVQGLVVTMGNEIDSQLQGILNHARDAKDNSEEAMSLSDDANAYIRDVGEDVSQLRNELSDHTTILVQIVDHLGLDRPNEFRAKREVRTWAAIVYAQACKVPDNDISPDRLYQEFLAAFPRAAEARALLGDAGLHTAALAGFDEARRLPSIRDMVDQIRLEMESEKAAEGTRAVRKRTRK